MQARCPRCASIFTTDRSGLQFCPNCGQQVDVPPFPGSPAEGGAGWGGPSGPGGPGSTGPGPAIREDTPWERRATVGWVTGFFETWKQTLLTPQAFWASVKPNGSWTDALIYGWILSVLGTLIATPFRALDYNRTWLKPALAQLEGLPPQARAVVRNALASSGGYSFPWTLILYPLFLLIGVAILHLFCMLFGASKNGYFATLRVVAYAAATSLFVGIPYLGFLAFLYGVVLIILGISSVQETTIGRAAAAVLVPWVLLCCCAAAVFALGASVLVGALHSHTN
jgi:hypothetical protein